MTAGVTPSWHWRTVAVAMAPIDDDAPNFVNPRGNSSCTVMRAVAPSEHVYLTVSSPSATFDVDGWMWTSKIA